MATILFRATVLPRATIGTVVNVKLQNISATPFAKNLDVIEGFRRISKGDIAVVLVPGEKNAVIVRFVEDRYYAHQIRHAEIISNPVPRTTLGPWSKRDRQVTEVPEIEVQKLLAG